MDAAEAVAERYESVPPGAWGRRGYRSNGSEFTVESIGLYHLHDLVHHAWDVRAAVARATVEAYDAHAAAYRDGIPPMPAPVARPTCARSPSAVGPRGRVLEIGSGAGPRRPACSRRPGSSVRRTDITPAFVELLRADGPRTPTCSTRSPTTSTTRPARARRTTGSGPAPACCTSRGPTCRSCWPGSPRPPGPAARCGLSLKEGDGEGWSTHGHVGAPRHFVYWREEPLRAVLEAAGWEVDAGRRTGWAPQSGQPWLDVRAARRGDEAHRVLGAHGAGARSVVRPVLGEQLRDARARRPHGRRRRIDAGVPPKEVWAAVWRTLELPGHPEVTAAHASTSRGPAPHDPHPRRRPGGRRRSASRSASRRRRCWPATSRARRARPGFAQTFQVLGTAFAAYLLARLMSHRGRRIGLVTGYLLGAAGARARRASPAWSARWSLLLVGALLLGSTTAANNSARYAATDLAEDAHKGRALSTVVWATTIGAVLGPNLTGPAGALADVLGIPELTGPFALGAIGMVVAAVVVGVLLRPDPLLLAREVAGVAETPPDRHRLGARDRRRPRAAGAVLRDARDGLRARRDGRR